MRRRGAILLEVVLALTLFLTAAALVGASIAGSLRASGRSADVDQAMTFAESLLARIRAGELADYSDGIEGDFAPHFPRFHYRINSEPDENVAELQRLLITVSWSDPVGPDEKPAGGSVDDDPEGNRVTLTGWIHGTPEAPDAGDGGGGAEP